MEETGFYGGARSSGSSGTVAKVVVGAVIAAAIISGIMYLIWKNKENKLKSGIAQLATGAAHVASNVVHGAQNAAELWRQNAYKNPQNNQVVQTPEQAGQLEAHAREMAKRAAAAQSMSLDARREQMASQRPLPQQVQQNPPPLPAGQPTSNPNGMLPSPVPRSMIGSLFMDGSQV